VDHFKYVDGQLYCEDVNVDELAAKVSTPLYLYSAKTFEDHYKRLTEAFKDLKPIICYSIKTCGNINLLKRLVNLGSGMDVVSGGELFRALQAGADPKKIVYAGVGKTDKEIEEALQAGIGWFNIESEAEFENISTIAKKLGLKSKAALRVNPDVADERTHIKTKTGNKGTKFGVDLERAKRFFQAYGKDSNLELSAVHIHIGSPIYSPEPYVAALERLVGLVDELKAMGHTVKTIDMGGGFSADYETEASPSYQDYSTAITPLLKKFVDEGGQIILEPGRTISGNAGVLISKVNYIKTGGHKTFVIVDTGMHHLIRPTLYESFHFIWPTKVALNQVPEIRKKEMTLPNLEPVDIVGPICESADYLAKDRAMPVVKRGDLICVFTAGAYGMVMASQYNAMPRPPEVIVEGDKAFIARKRESYQDLIDHELELTPV
jgi:diaminopimelate decarboxylase